VACPRVRHASSMPALCPGLACPACDQGCRGPVPQPKAPGLSCSELGHTGDVHWPRRHRARVASKHPVHLRTKRWSSLSAPLATDAPWNASHQPAAAAPHQLFGTSTRRPRLLHTSRTSTLAADAVCFVWFAVHQQGRAGRNRRLAWEKRSATETCRSSTPS